MSKLTEYERRERDRAIARKVVEEFIREFVTRPDEQRDRAFAKLCGRLDVSDEVFALWNRESYQRSDT
jgi:hypothetical protein